jgi:hypothetical protein
MKHHSTLRALTVAAVALAPLGPGSVRAAIPDDTVMAPLFAETCTSGALTPEAIEARLAADNAWVPVSDQDLAADQFGTVKSMVPVTDFKKPLGYRQWRRTVDGKEVRAVLASFGEKSRYRTLCALLVPDVKAAFPYFDGFEDAMKALGLKGKSTDLPHYQEYSGKLADGRKARGDIFSRTRVLQPGDNMHMYIAF